MVESSHEKLQEKTRGTPAERAARRKMKVLWMVEDVPANGDREARSYWTRIGAAFENRDGSFSVELSALPLSGRLQLRDPQAREDNHERSHERREAA